jgi:hypothetical protein
MITIILLFFFASYIMIACSYTFEACIYKEACKEACAKYWYLSLFAFIWWVLISLIYFPYDLGSKLYKKLNA